MGHRCNYVIKENNELKLYYSHWGALTVPQDIFWGPHYAKEFIEDNEERDMESGWLDDAFGEGGVALDIDSKTIHFFGGEELEYDPHRSVLEKLMVPLWKQEGWIVKTVEKMSDIINSVGLDGSIAIDDEEYHWQVDLEEIGSRQPDEDGEYMCFGLIILIENKSTSTHVTDIGLDGIINNGPVIFDAIKKLPDLDEAISKWKKPDDYGEWSFGDSVSDYAIIDIDNKILKINSRFDEDLELDFLKTQWPSWTIEYKAGSNEDFLKTAGIEMRPQMIPLSPVYEEDVEPTEKEVLQEVIEILLKDERMNANKVMNDLFENLAQRNEEINYVHPSAIGNPKKPPLSQEVKMTIVKKALSLSEYESTLP